VTKNEIIAAIAALGFEVAPSMAKMQKASLEGVLAQAEAAAAEKAAAAPSRSRGGSFTVENEEEMAEGTHVCRTCGEELPIRSFPTIKGPLHRGTQCRRCRDAGRASKAEAAAAAAAQEEAEAAAAAAAAPKKSRRKAA
jgi:hypothetical protein